MPMPVTFTRTSLLRQTEDQWRAVEEERRKAEKIPAYAEIVRDLIDEALRARRLHTETFQR